MFPCSISGDFVRKAKNGPTVSAKRFFFLENDKKFPRVEVTVDGYYFSFTCDKNLTPVIVAIPNAHGSIKEKAYAVAAQLFKTNMQAKASNGNAAQR